MWEAAEVAAHQQAGLLCGITDVNRLGQSRPTMCQHDLERSRGSGAPSAGTPSRSTVTTSTRSSRARGGARDDGPADDDCRAHVQGEGSLVRRGQAELARQAAQEGRGRSAHAELEAQYVPAPPTRSRRLARSRSRRARRPSPDAEADCRAPAYKLATWWRRAKRTAPRLSGRRRRPRVVVLDADVKQLDVQREVREGVAGSVLPELHRRAGDGRRGDGARGTRRVPFPSTFACFLTRAYNFIRMAASHLNVKLAGSHAGVSIGEDGPSQMALEDLAMMRAAAEHDGAVPVRRGERGAARRARRVPRRARLHPDEPPEDAGHLRTRTRRSPSAGRRSSARARATAPPSSAPASPVFEALKAYDD